MSRTASHLFLSSGLMYCWMNLLLTLSGRVGRGIVETHAAAVAFRPEDLPALVIELLLRRIRRRDGEVLAPRRRAPLLHHALSHLG